MRAGILSIGDELILGQTLDTNGRWIASELARRGVIDIEHRTIGDDVDQLVGAMGDLAQTCDVLVVTGGLGPTEDDLTRFALARLTDGDAPLVEDPAGVAHLEQWFSGRGSPMPERNLVQAMRPVSTRLLENPNGTAPGLAARVGDCDVILLPGPPREMKPMFNACLVPVIEARGGGRRLLERTVHAAGIGESGAADLLGNMLDRQRWPRLGITVSGGVITATVRLADNADDAEAQVREDVQRIERCWSPFVFGTDGTTLAERVGRMLADRNLTMATAESCTGGWLGRVIVDVDGCSDYFAGGWVTYANAMKIACLQVSADMLDEHGAVSAEVAEAMAHGALIRSGADIAISITGIAGPDGGTPGKPVGTVYEGLARRRDGDIVLEHRRFEFRGDRSTVRSRAVVSALQMIRLHLLEQSSTRLLWQAGE